MYQMNDETLNKIILSSPSALPISPRERGLSPDKIREYFYRPLKVLFYAINEALTTAEKDVLGKISGHDSNDSAHSDIREILAELDANINSLVVTDGEIKDEISTMVNQHNVVADSSAHPYLVNLIEVATSLARSAYNLASAKSTIYPFASVPELLLAWEINDYNVGDVFITTQPNVPDFTLISKGEEYNGTDLIANGSTIFEGGQVYYFEKTALRLGATDGGYDHSQLTLKKDFEELVLEVAIKENSRKVKYETAEEVELASATEYNLGSRTSLIITLPTEIGDSFDVIVNFHSPGIATSLDAPEEIIFTQDDCLAGHLYPVKNRLYEISIKRVNGLLIGKVNASDYEVIAE